MNKLLTFSIVFFFLKEAKSPKSFKRMYFVTGDSGQILGSKDLRTETLYLMLSISKLKNRVLIFLLGSLSQACKRGWGKQLPGLWHPLIQDDLNARCHLVRGVWGLVLEVGKSSVENCEWNTSAWLCSDFSCQDRSYKCTQGCGGANLEIPSRLVPCLTNTCMDYPSFQ